MNNSGFAENLSECTINDKKRKYWVLLGYSIASESKGQLTDEKKTLSHVAFIPKCFEDFNSEGFVKVQSDNLKKKGYEEVDIVLKQNKNMEIKLLRMVKKYQIFSRMQNNQTVNISV